MNSLRIGLISANEAPFREHKLVNYVKENLLSLFKNEYFDVGSNFHSERPVCRPFFGSFKEMEVKVFDNMLVEEYSDLSALSRFFDYLKKCQVRIFFESHASDLDPQYCLIKSFFISNEPVKGCCNLFLSLKSASKDSSFADGLMSSILKELENCNWKQFSSQVSLRFLMTTEKTMEKGRPTSKPLMRWTSVDFETWMFEVLMPEFYRDLFSANCINGRMFLSLTAADFDADFLGSMASYEHPLSNELNLNRFISRMARLPRFLAPYDDDLQHCLRTAVESKSVLFVHIFDDNFWVDMIIKNLHKLSGEERQNSKFHFSRTFIGNSLNNSDSTGAFLKSGAKKMAGAGHILVLLTGPALRCKELPELLLSWTQLPRLMDSDRRSSHRELLFSSEKGCPTSAPVRNVWLLLLEDISLERFPPLLLSLLKDHPTINFLEDTFDSAVSLLHRAMKMSNCCLSQESSASWLSYQEEMVKDLLDRVDPLGRILQRPKCLKHPREQREQQEGEEQVFRVFVSASAKQQTLLLDLQRLLASSNIEMACSLGRLQQPDDSRRDEKSGLFLQTLNRLHRQSRNIAQTMRNSRVVLVLMDNEHLASRDLLHCLCLAVKYRKPVVPIRTCRGDVYRMLRRMPAQGRLLLGQALTEELVDLSSSKWFAKEAAKLTQKLKR